MRRFSYHPRIAALLALTSALLLAPASQAQPDPNQATPGQATTASPVVACRADYKTTCHDEYAARNRAAVRACLIRNFDKLSPECQASMKAAQAREGARKSPPKP